MPKTVVFVSDGPMPKTIEYSDTQTLGKTPSSFGRFLPLSRKPDVRTRRSIGRSGLSPAIRSIAACSPHGCIIASKDGANATTVTASSFVQYGGADYFEAANDEILAIPMIETAQALENLEDIFAVPGIDMVYVGPNDLALDLGERPGAELDGGATTKAIAEILTRAKAAKIATGIFCSDATLAHQRLCEGFDLVTPGNDFNLLMGAMSKAVAFTKQGVLPK